jgi:hypothetical protein
MKMNVNLENTDINSFKNIIKIIKMNKDYFSNSDLFKDNNDQISKFDSLAYDRYIKFKYKVKNGINNIIKNSSLKESKLEKKLLNTFFEKYFQYPKMINVSECLNYLIYNILFDSNTFTVSEIIMLCHFKKINIFKNFNDLRKYYFNLVYDLFFKSKLTLEKNELNTNLGHDIYFINSLIHIKEYNIQPEIVIDHLYDIKNNLKGKLSKKIQKVIYRLIDYLLNNKYHFLYESDKHKKYLIVEYNTTGSNDETITCPICLDSDISIRNCVRSNCNHSVCKSCFSSLESTSKPYCKPSCCLCRAPINSIFTYK